MKRLTHCPQLPQTAPVPSTPLCQRWQARGREGAAPERLSKCAASFFQVSALVWVFRKTLTT